MIVIVIVIVDVIAIVYGTLAEQADGQPRKLARSNSPVCRPALSPSSILVRELKHSVTRPML
eukprot:6730223-Heterocapsa_arctica.AAC.1